MSAKVHNYKTNRPEVYPVAIKSSNYSRNPKEIIIDLSPADIKELILP